VSECRKWYELRRTIREEAARTSDHVVVETVTKTASVQVKVKGRTAMVYRGRGRKLDIPERAVESGPWHLK
jgi:hypothetical protein